METVTMACITTGHIIMVMDITHITILIIMAIMEHSMVNKLYRVQTRNIDIIIIDY